MTGSPSSPLRVPLPPLVELPPVPDRPADPEDGTDPEVEAESGINWHAVVRGLDATIPLSILKRETWPRWLGRSRSRRPWRRFCRALRRARSAGREARATARESVLAVMVLVLVALPALACATGRGSGPEVVGTGRGSLRGLAILGMGLSALGLAGLLGAFARPARRLITAARQAEARAAAAGEAYWRGQQTLAERDAEIARLKRQIGEAQRLREVAASRAIAAELELARHRPAINGARQ